MIARLLVWKMAAKLLIHGEKSARFAALVKYCDCQNIDYNVLQSPLDNIYPADCDNLRCFLIILNENDIVRYGDDYRVKYPSLRCVFPSSEAVELEASKYFCRKFLQVNGLSQYNPGFKVVYRGENPAVVIDDFKDMVIKADGLASGKGVFVHGEHFSSNEEAIAIVNGLLEKHMCVVVEEKLLGEEFSVISFCWRGVITHFPVIKDFKRRNNGDCGPNTGGMGTISFAGGLAPFVNEADYARCCELNSVVAQLAEFNGFLYGSFMKLVGSGDIKLIEYNVRPGDSEAVNMFALLESNLLEHLFDPINNQLAINRREYTFFRYLVPVSYPNCGFSAVNGGLGSELGSNMLIVDRRLIPGVHNVNQEPVWYPANISKLDITLEGDLVYKMSNSRAGGIFTHGTDLASVISSNNRYLTGIVGRVHYRTDIHEYFNPAKYAIQANATKFNYLGHLDNYNGIIGDIKKRIDESNLQIEKDMGGAIKIIGQIGDFANSIQFNLGASQIKLICSVDGAGTKTKFLEGHPDRFRILGSDIVVHNINDMYCNHGRPIALLDYFGCDKLDKSQFSEFIDGALAVCQQYGIALIGGETAEMRGIYQSGEVEVLGILLGLVADSPVNGMDIKHGNWIYGISSNGAHTNGYTKLREIDARTEGGMPADIKQFFSQPHKNYTGIVDTISKIVRINGLAHITGGGFADNIERILPAGLRVEMNRWELAPQWQWLFDHSGMDWDSFIRVFNAGYGFCILVSEEIPDEKLAEIKSKTGDKIDFLGRIV